ncbi:type I secretion system permease/ATPase [Thorsellia anophelis]|uniref:ATP-binding cassette, subfamily C, LapB n=1 Tax=Thorsellia anophelis DSM 18579 TaxID=1123402 RepID=A0A1I0DIV9_9GAMM|nr:type I secretion system permease/ATPase [Thorsellia anophelis]SET31573.1 ATP-binding cassette, subfamily C, LapB [Thorsellia anophelis DSM 18579]
MSLSQIQKDKIIHVFSLIAKHYNIHVSEERIKVDAAWSDSKEEKEFLNQLALQMGLSFDKKTYSKKLINAMRLPLVIYFNDGSIGVIESLDKRHNVSISLQDELGYLVLPIKSLKEKAKEIWVLRPLNAVPDARVDEYIKPYQSNWFRKIIFHDKRRYLDLFTASLIANVLTLTTTLFSMQIYDRVVPSQSHSTLWVLFTGVMIALIFEFLLKGARSKLTDVIGKRADSRITDKVFGHAIRIKTQAKSQSTGSFIAQIRELEQVRELVTSTTLGALLDIPFILLFFVVLWMIGGYLVIVPLIVVPLILIAGLIAQWPLSRLAKEGMRESALRNAMLVEAVEALDDIKLLRAEQRFQNLWNQINDVSSDISKKQRAITNFLTHWTQTLQSMTFVGVLLVGAYLVIAGELTTGALVATSILSSRTLGPIAQWTGVFARLQSTRSAYQGLNELMQKPVDQPIEENRLQRPVIEGEYIFEDVRFKYDPNATHLTLNIPKLHIKAGSKVGIIGKMGSGKSTLLHLFSGMITPEEGAIYLNGDLIKMIDVSDLRRDVGFLSQTSRLFHGTLRENLCMGRPHASNEEMIEALTLTGAWSMLKQLEGGLDYMVREGGHGLSGGQKQALLLSRMLIMNPRTLLLDEPTASMDQASEIHIVNAMRTWFKDKTVIVATHRPAVLDWVDTLIVIDEGKIILMGEKSAVLARLDSLNSANQKISG